jgi:hypothetical protein
MLSGAKGGVVPWDEPLQVCNCSEDIDMVLEDEENDKDATEDVDNYEEERGIKDGRVLVDHVELESLDSQTPRGKGKRVLDRFWVG